MPRSPFQRSEAVIHSSCLLCMLMLNREFPRYKLFNALALRYYVVHIPQHVWNEVARKGRSRPSLKRLIQQHPLFKKCDVGSQHEAKLLYDRQTNPGARIDRGEAETIIQARERGISEVLIDERKGTKIALAHSLSPRGIAGIIKEFKLNDIIPEARPLFKACKENRFWLSDRLVEDVLKETGEIPLI
jgi:predicted nucleic acid-binding protein